MQTNEIKHLLLIDDDEDDYFILQEIGMQFFPLIKISFIKDCKQMSKNDFCGVDMVLLDINMPRMSGFECLDLIRKQYHLYNLPIVMCSNSNSNRDIRRAYETGANLFLHKPMNFEKITQAINDLLSIDWSDLEGLTSKFASNNKVLAY
jgi:CheY-like chemotaxis protein